MESGGRRRKTLLLRRLSRSSLLDETTFSKALRSGEVGLRREAGGVSEREGRQGKREEEEINEERSRSRRSFHGRIIPPLDEGELFLLFNPFLLYISPSLISLFDLFISGRCSIQ